MCKKWRAMAGAVLFVVSAYTLSFVAEAAGGCPPSSTPAPRVKKSIQFIKPNPPLLVEYGAMSTVVFTSPLESGEKRGLVTIPYPEEGAVIQDTVVFDIKTDPLQKGTITFSFSVLARKLKVDSEGKPLLDYYGRRQYVYLGSWTDSRAVQIPLNGDSQPILIAGGTPTGGASN